MAAVFDLDLETEEGSEGEGEPEFSPAVSVSPGRDCVGAELVTRPRPEPWLSPPRAGCDPSKPRSSSRSDPRPPRPRSRPPAFRPLLPVPARPLPDPCHLPSLAPSFPGPGSPAWGGRRSPSTSLGLTPRFLTGRVSPYRIEGCRPGVSEGLVGGWGNGVGKGTWGALGPCFH